MENNKADKTEKLDCYLNAMLLNKSTHNGLKEIARTKRRDIQEVVRFALEGLVVRYREGKTSDDDLYK